MEKFPEPTEKQIMEAVRHYVSRGYAHTDGGPMQQQLLKIFFGGLPGYEQDKERFSAKMREIAEFVIKTTPKSPAAAARLWVQYIRKEVDLESQRHIR